MADTQIITERELNYIETLYLQCNLEDFIVKRSTRHDCLLGEEKKNGEIITKSDLDLLYGKDRYDHMLSYVYDTLLSNAQFLGDANGRMWYLLDNYRLGIMGYDKAKKSNQFNVVIQYEWERLYSLDEALIGLDLPFGEERNNYNFKRIDLCKIFKSKYDYLTNKGFISPYRKINKQGTDKLTETVYLGNRKNGNVYRMYNKSIELKKDTQDYPMDYKKIELLSKYFGDIENLYTFELELHRSYLKEQLEITTLDQLDQVYRAYHSIAGKIRIYEDTDQNKDYILGKHHDRIKANTITEYKEYKKVYRAKYKPSKQYAMDKQSKTFNRYIESMKITDQKEINRLKLEFAMNIASTDNQDITMTYEPSFQSKDYDDMKEKHEKLRSGDSPLDFEAYQAFKPHPYINLNEIF